MAQEVPTDHRVFTQYVPNDSAIFAHTNSKSVASFSLHSEYFADDRSPYSFEYVVATNNALLEQNGKITHVKNVGVALRNKHIFFNKRTFSYCLE